MINRLNLVPETDPILRVRIPIFSGDYNDIRNHLPEMFRVMDSNQGIGLAAPQVGLSMNFFVMNIAGKRYCVVNPVIVEMSAAVCFYPEGCLSFPNKRIYISRPVQIIACYEDEHGQFKTETMDGLTSRCFQHEYDHLQGKVFTEYEAKS